MALGCRSLSFLPFPSTTGTSHPPSRALCLLPCLLAHVHSPVFPFVFPTGRHTSSFAAVFVVAYLFCACKCHATTQDLFYPVVKAYHSGFDPENTPPLDPEHMNPDRITVDLNASAKAKVISTRIRCARNLAMFPVRLLFYFLRADWFVCFRHMERYVRGCCRRFVVVPLRLCVA